MHISGINLLFPSFLLTLGFVNGTTIVHMFIFQDSLHCASYFDCAFNNVHTVTYTQNSDYYHNVRSNSNTKYQGIPFNYLVHGQSVYISIKYFLTVKVIKLMVLFV